MYPLIVAILLLFTGLSSWHHGYAQERGQFASYGGGEMDCTWKCPYKGVLGRADTN